MSATTIQDIRGREVLDSRGRPTVEAEVRLAGGAHARASVPSGASTGAAEAHELRDGDPERHAGLGVARAVSHVDGEIRAALIGMDGADQGGVDARMIALDGTQNLSRLGANAALAISLAVARAGAKVAGQPLYRRLAEIAGVDTPTLPMPMVNILSGGLHAAHGMDVQDFLMIPVGAATYGQALDWSLRVRASAAGLMADAGLSTLLADEGGLSPGFADSREALTLMVRAIEAAGLRPGEDVAIGLDIAASGLVQADSAYAFRRAARTYAPEAMIDLLAGWVRDFPIVSIEDGLGEEDWSHWPALTRRLGYIQLIGDDLFCTSAARIERGQALGCANAALIKVNQAGTLTGALEALAAARWGGMASVVSARSGETADDFIADLAVGTAAGQIKIGSVRGAERLTKYLRLARIEEDGLAFAGRAALAGAGR
jgi:enolase